MPKIIFTSRYMRDAPSEQLQNYVKYIGTREDVEKIDESKAQLPATENQQKLICQLLRDIPSAKDMLEYSDYLLHPTRGNASEFISCALEQNLDLVGKRENYVDYIANRPRVERVGEHGLFTDAGTPVILSQVQGDVVNHKGPVWTHVISLRREDAAFLGYGSGRQWRELIRSKRAMLCKYMKIDSENLRWYCAFHNEAIIRMCISWFTQQRTSTDFSPSLPLKPCVPSWRTISSVRISPIFMISRIRREATSSKALRI